MKNMSGIMMRVPVVCKDMEDLRGRIDAIPELSQGYSVVGICATVQIEKRDVSKEEAERTLREHDEAHAQLFNDSANIMK